MSMAHSVIENDLLRAAARSVTGFRMNEPLVPQFESRGITKDNIRSYLRFGYHGCIHTVALQMQPDVRHEFVSGAMNLFTDTAQGYVFPVVYETLDDLLAGKKTFSREQIARLDGAEVVLSFLPFEYQTSATVIAKYLIASAANHHPNLLPYLNDDFDFKSFTSAVAVSIGATQRALDQLRTDFKMS